MDKLAPEHSEDWRELDVAVLHEVVLEHLLGITKDAQAARPTSAMSASAGGPRVW